MKIEIDLKKKQKNIGSIKKWINNQTNRINERK